MELFFSYTRRDPEHAALIDIIFDALTKKEGFSVFRDREGILPGQIWSTRIGEELESCTCGVALWTPSAKLSEVMLAETAYLLKTNKLVPISLAPEAVPEVYRAIQFADLCGFSGDHDNLEWRKLVAAIRSRLLHGAAVPESAVNTTLILAGDARPLEIQTLDPRYSVEPTATFFREAEGFPVMECMAPGNFTMGRDNARSEEAPATSISIARPFAISVAPISTELWNLAAVSGARNVDILPETASADERARASWRDAQRYIAWLNARLGRVIYRLPSEAEWTLIAKRWSEKPLLTVERSIGQGWEWTEDSWSTDLSKVSLFGEPKLERGNSYKTLRGGAWPGADVLSWCFSRTGMNSDARRRDVSFRVVRELMYVNHAFA